MSKEEGGLALRNLHQHNISLVAKQAWRLLSQPQSRWGPSPLGRLLQQLFFVTMWVRKKIGVSSPPHHIRSSNIQPFSWSMETVFVSTDQIVPRSKHSFTNSIEVIVGKGVTVEQ